MDRLFFDVTTSLRWAGPPVGMIRAERELARWAIANDPNCHFVYFDPGSKRYRVVSRWALEASLAGDVVVDELDIRDRRRKSDVVPAPLRRLYIVVTKFRRIVLRRLGELTLRSRSSKVVRCARYAMGCIAGQKYRDFLGWQNSPNRVLVRPGFLIGQEVSFDAGDCIFLAGSNWTHSNIDYIATQKRLNGLDLIALCYDIIPIIRPDCYRDHDVQAFRRYYEVALETACLILVTANVVARDVRSFCQERGITPAPIMQIPLGADVSKSNDVADRQKPTSRYIMFVSTIEPRKGHRLIHSVWRKLLSEGLPQRHNIDLLLVGRLGWLVDDVLASLSSTERIKILNDADDDRLSQLYDGATFCIYPSECEGYGLPIVEALVRGIPVIAAAVGIAPELNAPNLICLPPKDENAWLSAMRSWIVELPTDSSEQCVFKHPNWGQAAAQTFETIRTSRMKATGREPQNDRHPDQHDSMA